MTPKTIQINDLRFYTEHFGDPTHPACLLIAGAMASARFWSDAFCSFLAEQGFFVIRYDHRDIGESSGIDWKKAPYGLSDLAHDTISILESYGIEQAHFIGHSMGGYIVQAIALEFPRRARSITAISAGPIGATKETDIPLTDEEQALLSKTWDIMLGRKDGPSKESLIQSFMPVWKYLNGQFPLDEKMADRYTRDLILRSHHPIKAGNNHELVMRSIAIEKSRNLLQKIHVPTLVVHGEADPLVLPREGRALAHAIPTSTLSIISSMGHVFFHQELEKKIITLLTNFCK